MAGYPTWYRNDEVIILCKKKKKKSCVQVSLCFCPDRTVLFKTSKGNFSIRIKFFCGKGDVHTNSR